MNEVRVALDYILTNDVIVQALVGRDEQGFIKVYETLAPQNEEAPFVVWQIIPGLPPTGDFADAESMVDVDVQITPWGQDQNSIWQLHAAIADALRGSDWSQLLIPWEMIRLSRVGTPGPLPDETTRWWQLPNTWRVSVSR